MQWRPVMCRPSCCDNSGGQGAGIAAVALILIGALIVAKIGPIVAQIGHIALEVIRIAVVTAAAVLAVAVITWAVVMITRWQLRRTASAAGQTQVVVTPTIRVSASRASRPADCLACGGSGRVLKAIGGSRYQPGACPVCEPAQWAG
jgi:uncharacterized membrane protein